MTTLGLAVLLNKMVEKPCLNRIRAVYKSWKGRYVSQQQDAVKRSSNELSPQINPNRAD